MKVLFHDPRLDRLETDASYNAGFSTAIVKAFRKKMLAIRSSIDERAFYAMRSLQFERLKGPRQHQHSMRLNIQFRLVMEFEGEGTDKFVIIMAIEDYH